MAAATLMSVTEGRRWRSNRMVIVAATIVILGLEFILVRRNLGGTIPLTTPIYFGAGAVWLLCAWKGPLPTWAAALGVLSAGSYTGTALTTSPDGVLAPLGVVIAIAIGAPARGLRTLLLASLFVAGLVFAYSLMRALHGPVVSSG